MPGLSLLSGDAAKWLVAALALWIYTQQVEQRVLAEIGWSSERAGREKDNAIATQSAADATAHAVAQGLLQKELENVQNDLDQQIRNASRSAAADPVAFGDDIIRGFARSMCIIELGEFARDAERVQSCYIRAAALNTSNIDFTRTYGPRNLRRWAEACDERTSVFASGTVIRDIDTATGEIVEENDSWSTEEEWQAAYPDITPEMCIQSVVAFTPEAALNFEKYFLRLEAYARGLNLDIDVRDQAIDVLRAPPVPAED